MTYFVLPTFMSWTTSFYDSVSSVLLTFSRWYRVKRNILKIGKRINTLSHSDMSKPWENFDGYGFPNVEDIAIKGTIKVKSKFENEGFNSLQEEIYEKTVKLY